MIRITFSPFTADPHYVQSVANAAVDTHMQFAMAAWEAQMRLVQTMGMAALATQLSMVECLCQAHTRRG